MNASTRSTLDVSGGGNGKTKSQYHASAVASGRMGSTRVMTAEERKAALQKRADERISARQAAAMRGDGTGTGSGSKKNTQASQLLSSSNTNNRDTSTQGQGRNTAKASVIAGMLESTRYRDSE